MQASANESSVANGALHAVSYAHNHCVAYNHCFRLRASIRESAAVAVIFYRWKRHFGFSAKLCRAINIGGSRAGYGYQGGSYTRHIIRVSLISIRESTNIESVPRKSSPHPWCRVF